MYSIVIDGITLKYLRFNALDYKISILLSSFLMYYCLRFYNYLIPCLCIVLCCIKIDHIILYYIMLCLVVSCYIISFHIISILYHSVSFCSVINHTRDSVAQCMGALVASVKNWGSIPLSSVTITVIHFSCLSSPPIMAGMLKNGRHLSLLDCGQCD